MDLSVHGVSSRPSTNSIALGYDNGTILIKMGREVPAASMDATGKIIFARKNEIMTSSVRPVVEAETPPPEGETIPLPQRELGSCDVYPQMIDHSPNGRLCVIYGDGEYIIYNTTAWKNTSFGQGLEFVWGRGKGQYAVREQTWRIRIFNE